MTELTKAEQLADRIKQAAPLSMILIADECARELRRLSTMEARVKELETALRVAKRYMVHCWHFLYVDKDLAVIDKALGETK